MYVLYYQDGKLMEEFLRLDQFKIQIDSERRSSFVLHISKTPCRNDIILFMYEGKVRRGPATTVHRSSNRFLSEGDRSNF